MRAARVSQFWAACAGQTEAEAFLPNLVTSQQDDCHSVHHSSCFRFCPGLLMLKTSRVASSRCLPSDCFEQLPLQARPAQLRRKDAWFGGGAPSDLRCPSAPGSIPRVIGSNAPSDGLGSLLRCCREGRRDIVAPLPTFLQREFRGPW